MRLIDILALFKAIKNTAKKYHWKTTGSTFMSDHLLFDRIYDDIDDDQVDTMGVGRKDINDLDNLITLSAQYEGKSFSATSESIILMYQELARMMNTFLINIEKLNLLRGINSELDNLSSTITQLYGLVTARLCQ